MIRTRPRVAVSLSLGSLGGLYGPYKWKPELRLFHGYDVGKVLCQRLAIAPIQHELPEKWGDVCRRGRARGGHCVFLSAQKKGTRGAQSLKAGEDLNEAQKAAQQTEDARDLDARLFMLVPVGMKACSLNVLIPCISCFFGGDEQAPHHLIFRACFAAPGVRKAGCCCCGLAELLRFSVRQTGPGLSRPVCRCQSGF